MHQKKINKYYFTFLILLHTGLSQEYLPTLQIPLSTVRENRDFSPDLIASYANQLVFVDKKNHTIGIYSNDSYYYSIIIINNHANYLNTSK